PLSLSPPTSAVFPSADSAVLMPNSTLPTSSPLVSLGPCCDQLPPARTNTHAAPAPALSTGPPISAVLPSAETETRNPNWAFPTSSAPVSLGPCCDQLPAERTNTHAAPALALSSGPPTTAVFPSADSATPSPSSPLPLSSPPVSFEPCWKKGSTRSG